jgi:hypothetical protein
MSITLTQDQIQLEEYARRLELKVHQLEMERMYENELFANAYLSPAHKIVLRAIRQIIRTLRIDDSTPTPIHLAELVNKTGLSTDQIGRLINELDKWGLITKATRKWREGKIWKAEMTIAMGGQIKSSPGNAITPERNHGGARKQKCHNCGSENVEPVVYHCLDCGHHGPID